MERKIGIVTLFGNYNYGNKLQNYAVQEVAKKYGYEADTIVFNLSAIKEIYRGGKRFLQMVKGLPEMKRYKTFSQFNKEMLSVKVCYAPNSKVSERLKEKYQYFFVGSDQVWNPEIRKDQRNIFFLTFADKVQRVCISPSLGVSSVSQQYEKTFQEGLQGFEYLCCRELEGKNEIERLSHKECSQLIDPTMAISAEKWKEFSDKTPLVDRDYALCFFLGETSGGLKEKINMYALENDLMIVDPSDPASDFYSIDPRQLVNLIDKASIVFTDSFHIAAFSINLNKPFWVFDRFDKASKATHINSRIISLTTLFGVHNRFISDITNCVDFDAPCDFSEANEILAKERNRFYSYIEKCLDRK